MDFVTGFFATWLLEQLTNAGRTGLANFLLGGDQDRALRAAAQTAIERTAEDLCPSDRAAADNLVRVIDQLFGHSAPIAPMEGHPRLLLALQQGIRTHLAPLADSELTGIGESAADVLGVSVAELEGKLLGYLVLEIKKHGAAGDSLKPIADQLNHEVTQLQIKLVEGKVDQLADLLKKPYPEPGRHSRAESGQNTARWAPAADLYKELPRHVEIDTTKPNSARVWNYWLKGEDHYPVDRRAGERYLEIYPGIADTAYAVRRFMARAVRYLAAEAGVRQFLDIGTGFPSADNTHEVAQRVTPECRVVYVDNDPVVLAHARALLTSVREGDCGYVEADMQDTATILDQASQTLDFSRPVALLFMEILGHISDESQAVTVVRELMDGLAPGSYLALADSINVGAGHLAAAENYAWTGAVPYKLRSPEQIVRFFEGLRFIRPGLVSLEKWRPDPAGSPPIHVDAIGGVAKKRNARPANRKLP